MKIIESDLQNQKEQEAFIDLLNNYIKDGMGGGMPFETQIVKDKLLNDIKNFPTKKIFFAIIDEKFVGMAVTFVGYSTFNAKPLINIHDIIVLKEFRNKGIGKNLITAIFQKAKSLNCCKITLEVRSDNESAQHLYKKIGFTESNPPMKFLHTMLLPEN
ncbi:MAG: hypothetical protein A2086_08525 [Spirochaetes bacterium GWD1_27_9]|nr:MAG: hypothetical protein A2Z98_02360 [Spirochaetes bacterium GWB1_27_13]OHD44390.1 MAG: hypothetical protein A2086_08525 [Spirochaetes bacterium GWD1_27_9]